MDGIVEKLKKLFFLKVKFAMTSSVATLVDYGLYLALVYSVLSPVLSNIVSASCGMIVNFFLQKRFVFNLQRKVSTALPWRSWFPLAALHWALPSFGYSTIGLSFRYINTLPNW